MQIDFNDDTALFEIIGVNDGFMLNRDGLAPFYLDFAETLKPVI